MRVRRFCWGRGLFTILSVVACSGTLSSAAAYQFHWERPADFDGSAGPFFADDDAGVLNSLTLTYDSDAQNLTFLASFGESDDGDLPLGFSMVLNNGPEPSGEPGEYAILHFLSRGDDHDPILNASTYAGSALHDGHRGFHPRHSKRIASSRRDNDWINSTSVTDGDGTRVFAFDIDVSAINSFEPKHTDPADWFGIGFDDMIGLWLKTYALDWPGNSGNAPGRQHARGHGPWPHMDTGYFDFANQPTEGANDIPEPASLALLALGAAALCRRESRWVVDRSRDRRTVGYL